ncbi:MAG: phosphatidylglycerol lysyltransferase domain-containing protein [Pseudomonadota bacterium]
MTLSYGPILIDQESDYHQRLAACPQVSSDYSFVNLWSWADIHGLEWAWEPDLVWIRQRTAAQTTHWAPIGDWTAIDWQAKRDLLGTGFRFDRIPQQLALLWEAMASPPQAVIPRRGHWDYLYDTESLASLRGNQFHKKKNLVNQFIRNNTFTYLPFGGEMIEMARDLQSDWCLWRDCESSETLSAENRAIEKTLTHWDRLGGLSGGAIMVGDALVAYTISESLTKEMVVIHFEKANADFKGAYQAINQMYLETIQDAFRVVNREQDLDDEGLRKAKLSYNPIGYIEKYEVLF